MYDSTQYWEAFLASSGLTSLLKQLDYYESLENYEECKIIKDVIDIHNLVSGSKLKTKL